MTIQERVEAGAAWLDANRPGWVDRINLETLDLGDPCMCVLGQEFGHFYVDEPEDVVSGVGRWSTAQALGFGDDGGEYDDLTAAWRDYITARRAAA